MLLATGLSSTAYAASQLLRCEINEGGETYVADFLPTSDPYTVVAKNIGGRFRLKVVMMLNEQPIEYIKIYTYYKDPRSMVLLHVAKYLPPFDSKPAFLCCANGREFVTLQDWRENCSTVARFSECSTVTVHSTSLQWRAGLQKHCCVFLY